MRVEVSIAVNFVLSFLYNRLPRRRVNLIGEQLACALTAKFHGHWYPEQPLKGTAYRCLKISGDQSDSVIVDAATQTGLEAGEVTRHLPMNLTLWIDPGEVSCRVGEKGPVTQLYSASASSSEISSIEDQQQQQQQQQPCTAEPQWVYQQQHQQQQQQQPQQQQSPAAAGGPCYTTAAEFAQTKFGSSKLRQPPRVKQPRPRQQQQQQQMMLAMMMQHQQHQQHKQQQRLPEDFSGGVWSSVCYGNDYSHPYSLSVAIPSDTSIVDSPSGNSLSRQLGLTVYGQTRWGGSEGSCSGHSSPLMMSK